MYLYTSYCLSLTIEHNFPLCHLAYLGFVGIHVRITTASPKATSLTLNSHNNWVP